MSNEDVVRAIYEAFGRGDVDGVLAHLADDVEWEYGVVSTDVPWLQRRSGRENVRGFFASLGGLELKSFVPKELLSSGDTVVALIDLEGVVRRTGQRIIEEDEAHIWRFENGKVVRFRHRVDTHQHAVASRPATPA